ncbi:eukaryotic translation initiation factor 4E-binding protein 3-like isoform X1 [Convolutriloba macropyga]|uniref:eukaryotic translation initiation factor 4E-binding protein 3-like isoform X1 n=1 Tax=Convolutriloba macropyga TaxID=536237 RepID=UPI003F520C3A
MPESEGSKDNKASAQSTAIPIRYFKDESELPNNVSYSLGGTIYGTTPGGTRIIYSRDTLMRCKDSPLAKTPPKFLNDIPEEILRDRSLRPVANGQEKGTTESKEGGEGAAKSAGDDMFDMEQD